MSSWIREGARMTEKERMEVAITSPEMKKRGASHPRVMVFLGNILVAMEEALVSSIDCPPAGPDEIVLTLTSKNEEDGSLAGGCSIGPSLLVTAVMEDGVAELAGVQVGDRIVRVGTDNLISGVDGVTYSKTFATLMEESGRPLEIRFRRDNGLPSLNRAVLRLMFNQHDTDQSGTLELEELRRWMVDMSVDSLATDSPSTIDMLNLGPPTRIAAKVSWNLFFGCFFESDPLP